MFAMLKDLKYQEKRTNANLKKQPHLSQPLLFNWKTLSTKFNRGTLRFGGVHCKKITIFII